MFSSRDSTGGQSSDRWFKIQKEAVESFPVEISERHYLQGRSAAEWRLAKTAAHPEAQRRHAELAQRYSVLANIPDNIRYDNKCSI